MMILIGASASGKTELAKILFEKYGYQKCITTTTRRPRVSEKDGRDYHFLTKMAFEELKEADAFVETSVYQENYYGVQKKDLKKNHIIILDPNGANHLVKNLENKPFVVYIQSSDEIRKKRMIERKDNSNVIRKRIEQDGQTFKISKLNHIDLVLNNEEEDLEELAYTIHQQYQKRKAINY